MSITAKDLTSELKSLQNKRKAIQMSSFFKTGKGEYAEGDIFWGIYAEDMNKLAKRYYKQICLSELQKLLDSQIHEQRSVALRILVLKFSDADINEQNILADFYLANTKNINNWDLVDISAPHIWGAWGFNHDNTQRNWQLAQSQNLWEQRISVVSTLYFISHNIFEPTIELAEHFLLHQHDLMQKAVGWMLREVGKRNEKVLTDFLDKYSQQMPRTMLRYSIERLSLPQKKHYMKK